jgi:dTDP-glucose 4,6-dehydratase
VSFAEGIATTARWYAERRDWWEPLKSRVVSA